MSEKKNKIQNPFNYFMEMATGSLLSSSADNELKPDENAGSKQVLPNASSKDQNPEEPEFRERVKNKKNQSRPVDI